MLIFKDNCEFWHGVCGSKCSALNSKINKHAKEKQRNKNSKRVDYVESDYVLLAIRRYGNRN